jgi:phosphatidate cytidylyltransferase
MEGWAWDRLAAGYEVPSLSDRSLREPLHFMLKRVLTAIVLIPPVLYLIGWSPKWLFLLAVVITVERGLFEYYDLARHAGYKPLPFVGYAAAVVLCPLQAGDVAKASYVALFFLVFVLMVVLALALWRVSDLKDYPGAVMATLFGIVYVALTLACVLPLRFSHPEMGRNLMLLLFLAVWAGDIFAYLIGRSMGRRLLFPRVSPRKTVEGSIAGLAGSLLATWIYAHWFWRTAPMKTVLVLAGVVAVAGQIGDLAESAMKRGANVKDSGAILPGHGGLLDRIDSLLFGAPALWLALYFVKL